ncbi:metallo-beta-lactamase [Streptantibioticus cattleyicolor NRRL 8057 = DSM 46488]|uniref:Metallo-beta-lactamase n=1 Tax=Streptantibioticus cattleyicolor (strain ATCC 35852 / DSM 46488 / JCM 4925 / NBRC 14057 / NRRL 8057) TaxID=1003195 RepID=G8WNC8_STREN|nr:metallo-beta-lactamase [Streptantibioticus cattleyicolor NRRL 8057 = DSM 46488]
MPGVEKTERDGWERLAPGVARRRLAFLDVTIGVVVGTDGVLLIDSGSTVPEGERLRREVRDLTGRDVTHLALTHAHFDHVLGASAFPEAAVYGQAGLAGVLARGRAELGEDAVRYGVAGPEARRAVDALVTPGHPVDRRHALDLGGREALLVHPGPGHTGHDLAVVVPGTPVVVFCGDLVEESGEPQAGPDAVPGRWPAALDALLELGGETAVYVPGHGAVVDARFVRAQRDALARRFAVG